MPPPPCLRVRGDVTERRMKPAISPHSLQWEWEVRKLGHAEVLDCPIPKHLCTSAPRCTGMPNMGWIHRSQVPKPQLYHRQQPVSNSPQPAGVNLMRAFLPTCVGRCLSRPQATRRSKKARAQDGCRFRAALPPQFFFPTAILGIISPIHDPMPLRAGIYGV